jgi:hypothetical protein
MVFHEKIKKKLKVIFLMFLNHFNVLISKIKIYYFDIYTYIYIYDNNNFLHYIDPG